MIVVPMLLEACIDGTWRSVRISHKFSSVRSALDSLPTFTRQQKIDLEDVRVKALRTEEQVTVAERAINAYNTGRGMNMAGIPMLFEVRFDVMWHSMMVTREFSSIREAIDSLPRYAFIQQKVPLEDVRVKVLRTKEQVTAAEQAVTQFWATGK